MRQWIFKSGEALSVIQYLTRLLPTLQPEKRFVLEVKEYREKRSLDANALFWKVCALIAENLGSDKDSVYIDLLERYGVFTHVIVKPAAVEAFRREYRLCKDLGEVTVNGQTGNQLQCYFGSSTYDKKQMARLIDGAISELKEMGIPFTYESERDRAVREWGE